MRKDTASLAISLSGDLAIIKQDIGRLSSEKSSLEKDIFIQKNQFEEEKGNHFLQIDSLRVTISRLQKEISDLDFLGIEKHLQHGQLEKEKEGFIQYINYLRSVVAELDRQMGLKMAEIARLDLTKDILAKLDERIVFARLHLDEIDASIATLPLERQRFEIEKQQFTADKIAFDISKERFKTEAAILLQALISVKAREDNVARIELSQLGRHQKSTLKITAEKLNGVP